MSPKAWITLFIATAALPTAATASVVFGAPPAGPVTLHNGSFDIDLNSDGFRDLSLIDQPAYENYPGPVMGSFSHVFQDVGTGIYRGTETGDYAAVMNQGQTVGAPGSNFVYSDKGLLSDATIHVFAANYANGLGESEWIDGGHHFLGVDVRSGTDHHYGWIEISLPDSGTPTASQPWYDVTIYDWAYETDADVPVTIPEPSAVGAVGLLLLTAILRRSV